MELVRNSFVKTAAEGLFAGGMAVLERDKVVMQAVDPSFAQSDDTHLTPGEEIALSISLRDLPRSITVKGIKADITIEQAQAQAGKSVAQKSTVTESGGQPRGLEVVLDPPLSPSSLEVRLEGGGTFWTFSNLQMMIGTHDLPDFSDHVNTHLDGIDGSDAVLTFLVKADGPGTARIRIKSLDYTVIQTQAWPGTGGGNARQDRDFTLRFGEIATVPLDVPSDQVGDRHRLAVVNCDVRGEIGSERLLPDIVIPDRQQFVTVNAEYSIAQELSIPANTFYNQKPIEVVGVACSFLAEAEAQIHVGVYEDASGMPAESPPIAQASGVVVSADMTRASAVVFIQFDQLVFLNATTAYWIVFKGVQGIVQLGLGSVQHSYLKSVLVNRGGQYWKALKGGGLQNKTATHLVYVPGAEQQIPPIEIFLDGITSPLAVNVGVTAEIVHISVPQQSSTGGATSLTIRSRAQGTLNIENITREYLPIDGTATMKTLIYRNAAAKMLRGVRVV